MRFVKMFIVGLLLLSSPVETSAEFVLSLGQGSTIGITNVAGVAGQSIELDVYVTQRGTYAPVPSFPSFVFGDYRLSNDPNPETKDGLGSFVFDVTTSSSLVRNSGLDSVNLGSGFLLDNAIRNNQPLGALRVAAFATADLSNNVLTPVFVSETFQSTQTANNGPVATNSIRLGSVRFDIDSLATTSSQTITVSSPFNPNVDTLKLLYFGTGGDLFSPGFEIRPTSGSVTLSITAVPEPCSLALLAVVGSISAYGIRRKRKRQLMKA